MALERYVVLLRESKHRQNCKPAFQLMEQHAGESDIRLEILKRACDIQPTDARAERLPDKTRIVVATDPFCRTDQINNIGSRTEKRAHLVIVAVVGPFILPFEWERFVRLWSDAGRGLGTRLLKGYHLAEKDNKKFFVDLLQDYDTGGDSGLPLAVESDDEDDIDDSMSSSCD